jgi:hypothetical protein
MKTIFLLVLLSSNGDTSTHSFPSMEKCNEVNQTSTAMRRIKSRGTTITCVAVEVKSQ